MRQPAETNLSPVRPTFHIYSKKSLPNEPVASSTAFVSASAPQKSWPVMCAKVATGDGVACAQETNSTFSPLERVTTAHNFESSALLLEGEEDAVEIVLNDVFIANFASMEARRKRGSSGNTAGRRGADGRSNFAASLPEQEESASRAVQQERRDEKLRKVRWYGAHVTEVRALEAILNESFDRISHLERPVIWPAVPLR